MNKTMADNRGLTLVELLATIVIISIILFATFNILMTSFSNYNKVTAENTLRDEADLILAQLHRELYPKKESEINYGENMLELKDGSKLGFTETELIIKNSPVIFPSNVQLITKKHDANNYSQITKKGTNSYEIKIVLKNVQKNIVRTFESEITTINDLKTGGQLK